MENVCFMNVGVFHSLKKMKLLKKAYVVVF